MQDGVGIGLVSAEFQGALMAQYDINLDTTSLGRRADARQHGVRRPDLGHDVPEHPARAQRKPGHPRHPHDHPAPPDPRLGRGARSDEPGARGLRLRSGARDRKLPERRRCPAAGAAIAERPLGVHELRRGDRLVRQHPDRLVSRPARTVPGLRDADPATLPRSSSSSRPCSSRLLRRVFGLTGRGVSSPRSSSPCWSCSRRSTSSTGSSPTASSCPRPALVLVAQIAIAPSGRSSGRCAALGASRGSSSSWCSPIRTGWAWAT